MMGEGNEDYEVRLALLEDWRRREDARRASLELWVRSGAVVVFGSMLTIIAKGFGWL